MSRGLSWKVSMAILHGAPEGAGGICKAVHDAALKIM
jgi:hypothetical protein